MNRRIIRAKIAKAVGTTQKNISNISENKTGMYSRIYLAKAGKKGVVLKTRIRPAKGSNITEKVALKYLQQSSVKVAPKMLMRERDAILQQKVGYRQYKGTEQDLIKLGKTLHELHSIKFGKFGTFGKGKPRKPGTITDFFQHHVNAYVEYTKPSVSFFEQFKQTEFTKTWLPLIQESIGKSRIKMRELLNKDNLSLIHNDLHKGNIMISRKKSYLIDWENSQVGDPALDLAVFLNLNRLDKKQLSIFLNSYGVKQNSNFFFRVKEYRIIHQSFRILTFANAILGRWGPRATDGLIKRWMINNLVQYAKLTGRKIDETDAKRTVYEIIEWARTHPSAIA